MRRFPTAILILGAILMTASAMAEDAYGIITVRGYPDTPRGLPVTVRLDLRDLAEGLGLERVSPDDYLFAVETPEGLVPLGCQRDLSPEGATLVSFMPPDAAGQAELRVRILPVGGPGPAPRPTGGVQVVERDSTVTVRNEQYEAIHDPHSMGGLPSRIDWLATGKTFAGYLLNDRLYRTALGQFWLRNDDEPKVEVLARGPLGAIVRVSARYLAEGPTATNARAVYLFHYFAGSPVVYVEARMEQDSSMQWDECHLLEINFPDDSFTQWASSEAPEPSELRADQESHTGVWGALIDGDNVLGMFGGTVRIYDGKGGYGTYVHGPWLSTTERELRMNTHLYIGSGPGALRDLAALASPEPGAEGTELTTSIIETLSAGIAQDGDPRAQWAGSLIARRAGSGRLAEVTGGLRAVRRAVEAGEDATAVLGRGVRVLSEGWLIAAIREADDGVSLASLWDSRVGREYLRREQPLWEATFRTGEGKEIVTTSAAGFGEVVVIETPDGARIRWAEPTEAPLAGVVVEQRFAVTDDTLACSLRVDHPSEASLLDVTPLPLGLARLGRSPADDWVLDPKVSGGLVQDPGRSYPGHSGVYPSGWTSFQFGAFYDPDGGLYFGCHDPEAWTKEIRTKAAGGGVDAGMKWFAADRTRPGNGFRQSGETVVRLFEGDWFDAARIYRGWAEKHAEWWPDAGRPDTPEWMKDIAVWVNASGHSDDVVPKVKRFAEYMGVPTALHWYSWHEIPFDVNYPHYFPAKPGFAEGVAELQAAGVRVMPYINGRLWDINAEDFQTVAFPSAAKKEDGQNYAESYGSGTDLAPMCPTTDLWRDTVRQTVVRLCGPENNVDGVYIDQVAAAAPAMCHDPSHGHPLGGGSWWTKGGYWELLARLREELRDLSPEKMITTECNAEPYARFFDGYLTWHFWYGDQAPITAAVYGGTIQLFGRTSEGGEQSVRLKTAQALVWGEQVGWYGSEIMDHAVNGPFLRRCARLRHHLREFLARGRMEHPPALSGDIPNVSCQWRGGEATYPAVQAGAWSAPDGRLAVIFANVLDEPLTLTWKVDGDYYAIDAQARMCAENGFSADPGPRLRTPGEVEVSLGPCEVVAYVVDAFEAAAR